MKLTYCDKCGDECEGHSRPVVLCAAHYDYCDVCYPKILTMLKTEFPRPPIKDYNIIRNLKDIKEEFGTIACLGDSNCKDPQDCPYVDECMEKMEKIKKKRTG